MAGPFKRNLNYALFKAIGVPLLCLKFFDTNLIKKKFAVRTLRLDFPITWPSPWKQKKRLQSHKVWGRAGVRITSKYLKVFPNIFYCTCYKNTMSQLILRSFDRLSSPTPCFLFPQGICQVCVVSSREFSRWKWAIILECKFSFQNFSANQSSDCTVLWFIYILFKNLLRHFFFKFYWHILAFLANDF